MRPQTVTQYVKLCGAGVPRCAQRPDHLPDHSPHLSTVGHCSAVGKLVGIAPVDDYDVHRGDAEKAVLHRRHPLAQGGTVDEAVHWEDKIQ